MDGVDQQPVSPRHSGSFDGNDIAAPAGVSRCPSGLSSSDPRRVALLESSGTQPPVTLIAVQAAVLVAVLAVHYWHVLARLVYIWSNNGNWSHGFIIPLFSIYYLYLQRHRFPRGLNDRRLAAGVAGAALLTAAFCLYVRSALVSQEYPKTIALVISVMGAVLMVCGWPIARWSWFAVAFLLFAMPVPQGIYDQLTMPLRGIAARVSAGVLGVLPGIVTEPHGTVVEFIYQGRTGTLDVEQACSGMRLMVTMMALGVAMAFVNERYLWQRMVVILACVPIAILCNVIRVTVTGFFVVFGRSDLASGVPHMMLGLGMLAVAFGLYGGISYVLNHLFVEAEPDNAGSQEVAVA